MKGYLSPADDESRTVSIDGRVSLYRDPDRGQEVVVETARGVTSLGVADVTVSRKKGDRGPVVIEPQAECIEVRNEGNANGVVVDPAGEGREVEEGFSARLSRDTRLKLGYQTEVELTVEREAREEYVIQGDLDADGDVTIGGDKVDDRTVVEDVVAKDLNVGDDGSGPTEVRDAVAGEMNVGGDGGATSDTHRMCDSHGPYTGDVCPECAAARAEQAAPGSDGERERETKYCLFCGEEIPEMARVCPACGEDLPE